MLAHTCDVAFVESIWLVLSSSAIKGSNARVQRAMAGDPTKYVLSAGASIYQAHQILR